MFIVATFIHAWSTGMSHRWLARSLDEGGAGGLDWAKTNTQGHAISHKAALKGHRGLLEWLREQSEEGAIPPSIWGKDEGGYTPPDIARLAGHIELADWLDKSVRIFYEEEGSV